MAKRISIIALAIILIAVVIVVVVMSSRGEVAITMKSDKVVLEASHVTPIEIAYDDVDYVRKETSLDLGSRKNGIANSKINAGLYRNDEYGDYQLYSYAEVETFVVVELENGQYIVFNADSVERTEQLYQELKERT